LKEAENCLLCIFLLQEKTITTAYSIPFSTFMYTVVGWLSCNASSLVKPVLEFPKFL